MYHEFDDFQNLWNKSATLEEAAFKLGCSKREASARACAHRRKGRELKEFDQPPKPPTDQLRAPDAEFDKLLAKLKDGRRELTYREQLLAGELIARRAKLLRGEA